MSLGGDMSWRLVEYMPKFEIGIFCPLELLSCVTPADPALSTLGYRNIIHGALPRRLRSLTIFEDFNADWNKVNYFDESTQIWPCIPEYSRTPCPSVGAALTQRSISLERLSASFMIEAKHFYKACEPSWMWNDLRHLALTSRLLTSRTPSTHICAMLMAAGAAGLRMPSLERLEIWHGMKRNACIK
jgi:hypothetical protein